METVSVILQVASYKLTKRQGIFRMGANHHHFRVKAEWAEPKVIVRFNGLFTVCLCFSRA